MSEMELSLFRQRSIEALRQKARRGELLLTVAVGYVKAEDGQLDKDPDRRVQDGIALVFRKFTELQSIRQVLLWFRQEQVLVPAIVQGRGKQAIEWKVPVYHTLHHMLTNPVYAGAYAFGRRGTRVVIEGGRKRVMRDSLRRNWKDWEVLIRGHHDAYISWEEFERNQRLIPANGKSYLGRGAIRRGEALLPELFRCARCGRRLHVAYSGNGGNTQRYICRGTFGDNAADNCIRFGGMRVTGQSPRRFSADCSRSASRQRWLPWRRKARNIVTSDSRSRMFVARPGTRRSGRTANMTRLIPRTGLSPVNSSDAGTRS
ncbi:recombinase family protein [Pseudaminobacter sp. NGMCC 1.201702]|uniref:recombinase family protein n=1 Tax=Pseudaminobacter sp. NGMCC 1.201702 TaxID=3391825 RepID=UPI0039EE071D